MVVRLNKKAHCGRCGETNPEKFSWKPSVGYYHNYCKACDKIISHEYYLKNKNRIDKRHKEWQDNNRDLHLQHVRKYEGTPKYKKVRERYESKKRQGSNQASIAPEFLVDRQ